MTADSVPAVSHQDRTGPAADPAAHHADRGTAAPSEPARTANPESTTSRSLRDVVPQELIARLTRRVVTGSHPATEEVRAPFTVGVLAEIPQSTPGDVQMAFETARSAQREWARRSPAERAAVFLRFHDLVLDRQAEALDLVQAETGKARKHAFEEVMDVAITARHYARVAAGQLRPRRRRGALPVLTRAYELRHPKGVVGIISPWNYPLSLAVSDAVPAFLAGNGVVLKPDSQTSLSALWAHELATQAGLPENLWQIVVGDGPVVGPAVVDHADYVSFTGSTRTGRQVGQQATYRLVGVSLELGGKNAMLVLDDADLDRAAEGAVRACFSSAGQLCISIERMYVHYSVHDAFMERFLERVRAMRLSAGFDFTADMGSLVSARQLDTVTAHVEDARAKGAKVLTGGRRRPDIGPLFFEPTVLTDVGPAMLACGEETFGPVVSVYSFRTEDEAIDRANDTDYGLNASVWTRDRHRGRDVAARLRAGTVNVNEGYGAAWGSIEAPMGGMGDSGLGRRHGTEGLLKYTEAQTVAVQRLVPLAPPFGMPDERYARLMTRSLKLMKTLRLK
jgi:succinate-semialdehyde dehydrogenase / glutarate-semialdehyde dehydrogenase